MIDEFVERVRRREKWLFARDLGWEASAMEARTKGRVTVRMTCCGRGET
jgi:hypothetical protein